ncbi:MAG: hypothetical protein V2J07_10330 [Anaerolineae bacterium]|jgi:hypothetical protein|nr:hypothetical protein [Anaerolineae bacterium]
MKRCLRWLPVLGVCALFLLVRGSVHADMRPPLPPGGGNVSTETDTWVQLVFETVLLDVRQEMAYDYYTDQDELQYIVRVTADFTLLNYSDETETMEAVFPLTSIDPSASYSGSTVFDFSVEVEGVPVEWVPIESELCPYTLYEDGCIWGQFPVTFPPDEMVNVTVNYGTYLGDVGAGLGYRYVTYILTTGAAWHGPIWEADIILQLPYEATEQTVVDLDYYPWDVDVPEQEPVFDGNQVRWNYHSFEPDRNWGIYFADPAQWVRIEELQRMVDEEGESAQLLGEMGQIYWNMCLSKGMYEPALAWLGDNAMAAYLAAIELDPENPYLHGEYAEVLLGIGSHERYTLNSIEKLEQAIEQYELAVAYGDEEDYEYYGYWQAMAGETGTMIAEWRDEQVTATPTVTETPRPTITRTSTPQPTITPTSKATLLPPTPTPVDLMAQEPGILNNLAPILLIMTVLGIGGVLVAIVLVVVALRMKKSK